MPTQLNSSLIPAANRLPIDSPTARGNYRTSVQRAGLWTGAAQGGVLTALNRATFTHTPVVGPPVDSATINVRLLLFGNDTPALLRARSTYGAIADGNVSTIPQNFFSVLGTNADAVLVPELDFDEEIGLISSLITGTNNVLATQTPAVPGAAYQQQVEGTTATNGITVSGYAATVALLGRGMYASVDPVFGNSVPQPCTLDVEYLTDADVADGWVPATITQAGGGTLDPTPVIFDETLYTQAMYDAGNTFDFVAGNSTRRAYIVGLFAVFAA